MRVGMLKWAHLATVADGDLVSPDKEDCACQVTYLSAMAVFFTPP